MRKSNRDRYRERAIKLFCRPDVFEIPTPEEAEAELAAIEEDSLTNEQIDAILYMAIRNMFWEIALNEYEGGAS
jgi:hypothetical protein